MGKTHFLVLVLLFSLLTSAQQVPDRDSLLNRLSAAKEDSNKVLLLIQLGQQYENNDPETAKKYYKEAGAISNAINYPRGVLKYIANYTYVLNMEGLFDSSLSLNLQAVSLAKKIGDKEYTGKSIFNTGTSYNYKGDFENAARYYEEGRLFFEQMNDPVNEGLMYDNLQILYRKLQQYDKAIVYGDKAVSLLEQSGNSDQLGIALLNLGLNYSSKNDYINAENYFKQSLTIARKTENLFLEAAALEDLTDIDLNNFRTGHVKEDIERELEIAEQAGLGETKVIALRGLGIYNMYIKHFPESKKYYESSLYLADSLHMTDHIRKALEGLANLHYAMHDFVMAEKYLKRSDSVGMDALDARLQSNIQELEKKYETERKENTIRLQGAQLQNRRNLNYILGGAAVALLIISLLSYRTYRQKQKIQQQRINELVTEKKLAATEAVLKGEEQERSRLAKDLHDGLSGMLSGVKYSLQDMKVKGNLIMTVENQQAFERSMDMLDSSIIEMRRVAHNMMPEVLVRYGLGAALKDYIAEINKSGIIKVVYQSMGMAQKEIEQSSAIAIYRIVQELLNNVIKHAQATDVLVQLFGENGKLVVNVEDNGKGFDVKLSEEKGGMGWKNIRSRVELLKGLVDIQSSPGNGTSVNLDFNLG